MLGSQILPKRFGAMEFIAGLGGGLSSLEEFFAGRLKGVLGFQDQRLLVLKFLSGFREARLDLGAFAPAGLEKFLKLVFSGGRGLDRLAQLVLFLQQLAALLGELHALIPDELKFLVVRLDLRESLIALALFDVATLADPADTGFLVFDRLMLGLKR